MAPLPQASCDDASRPGVETDARDEFREIVNSFRDNLPEVTLSTDIICGFPGELDQHFERTLKLIDEMKPDVVNVSKFFARPGTAACQLSGEAIPMHEIKSRSTKAALLAKKLAYENNMHWIGWQGKVIVDEKGKVPGSWIARNFAYKPVVIRSPHRLFGRTVEARITGACTTYLEGTTIG